MTRTDDKTDTPARQADTHARQADKTPPAGPHAKERLIDRDKTPGTGALSERGQKEADVGPD